MSNSTVQTSFSSRVQWLLKQHSNDNYSDFARKIGVSPPSVKRWIDKGYEPSRSVLVDMADKLNVDLVWLMTGQGSPDDTSQPASNHDEYCYVPFYKGVIASAGGGKFSDGVIGTDDFLAFRKDWITRTALTAKDLVALNTNGDSMFPTIPENATVLIDKSKNIARDGRIYVIRIGEQLYVKRTQWLPTGLRLISDNKERYDPIDLTKAELEGSDVEIYGQVIHISYDLPR